MPRTSEQLLVCDAVAAIPVHIEYRIPPNKRQVDNRKIPKEPYAEVCTFEEADRVTVFMKNNNKVTISFGLTASLMRPINCFFDTGAGPNLLSEEFIRPDWLPSICSCDSIRLNSATNQKVKIVGKIVLHVRTGKSFRRVMFGIFRNLAVIVLLGSLVIDRFINSFFHGERKVVLFNLPPVRILMVHEAESDKAEEKQDDTLANIMAEQYFNQVLVRDAHTVALRPLSETSVSYAKNARRIVQIDTFTQF